MAIRSFSLVETLQARDLLGVPATDRLEYRYGEVVRTGDNGRKMVYDHKENRWVPYQDAYRNEWKRLTGL